VTESAIERYFAVLGLPSTASEEEVKEARNFVTKAFHPDKYQAGSKDQMKAHQRQIEINEAYERLIAWFQSKKRVQGAALAADGKRAEALSQAGGNEVGFSSREKIVTVFRIALPITLSVAWIAFINASFSSRAQTESTSISVQPPGAGAFVSPPPDWLFLLLILCTLGLCWVLFAPEAKLLIGRWTKADGGHESIGSRGVGGN
jgi:hypothetical protein